MSPDTPHRRTPDRPRRVHSLLIATTIAFGVLVFSADYVVEPGDTLATIAADHGATVSGLVDVNGIADPDMIRPGDVLVIPGQSTGEPATTSTTSATHVVSLGESLAGIAARHGTTASAIAHANGIADPDLIRAGQVLTIPATTTGPAQTTYTVRAGDTLGGIAARLGTTVEALSTTNGITDGVIYAGTTLRVGGPAPPPLQPTETTGVHVIGSGETLAGIANRYGTTVRALVDGNAIVDPDLIQAGQELSVPMVGWRCPVPGATAFNDWGFPRSGGRFHQGNDLFAPIGTPVHAPVSGMVRYLEGSIGGLQFWLDGDDGATYIGTHLSSLGAPAGRVAAGTVIGTVGATGNAAGARPHLHFEMHIDDQPVNPWPTLVAAGC